MGLTREQLKAYWMPFTANRQFKGDPRMIAGAEGVYLRDDGGRRILDGLSGLWCTGAGHNRPEIADAVAQQLHTLDYSPAFQYGHEAAFVLASRIAALTPGDLNHVFFTNSGSECMDTALKMARAYWTQRGQPGKNRLIGRVRGYHGVNFGGTAVGGIEVNRRLFGPDLLADHLPDTLRPENAFTRGQPQNGGAAMADHLLALVERHGAASIAAVVVEPVVGSGGVVPPPAGYLERLREICTEQDILLIFDEVITGLGRCGAMSVAERFEVVPDIMALAKQLTNGVIPMGAVVATGEIHDTIMAAGGPDYVPEFPHGYTYSGHPVACAAALAALDILEAEALPQRVARLAPEFEQRLHSLRDAPNVVDIRNFGFAGALQLAHYPGEPARRPYEVAMRMWQQGFYVRYSGENIALGLPFIIELEQIDALVAALREALVD